MWTRRILLAGAALLAPCATAGQDGTYDAVDRVFGAWNSTEAAGCAVGVQRDGHRVLSRAYGMADLEHDIRNTPATIFEAGSVSKQFTAAAIVLLVQDGRLRLDDDVRQYVPELPDYGTTITLRHLLTHTSGLRDWGSVAAIGGWGRSNATHTHDHVLDILSRQSALNFEPGHEYSYSNSGYNLLAIIVGRVSGMSFADFSRTRIFEPLGLRDTQWRDDYTRIVKNRSSAYAMRDDAWVIDRPIENVHGNGGLLTTVADLLAWNDALAAGTLGGTSFVDMMHERGVLNSGQRITYASGLVVSELSDVPEVSHTGATSGYRAFLARYPDQRLGVAVLCNAGNVNPGLVGRSVARHMLGQPVPAVTTTVDDTSSESPVLLTAAALQEFAGQYHSADAAASLTVLVEGDRLALHRRPGMRVVLEPISEDVFSAGGLGRIRFIRAPGAGVTALSVQQARVYDLRFERTQ